MEIIVTMSIIMTLTGVVVGLNYVISQTQILSFSSLLTVESANRVASTLAKEIRTSRYSESGSYPIELADAQELVFYSDVDFDGDSDRVRYFLEDSVIKKEVIPPIGNPPQYNSQNGSTRTLAENIRNAATPIFFYYDANFPETTMLPLSAPAQVGDVRMVQIVIRSNEQENFPDKDYILDTYVQLRLLKHEDN